MFKSSFAIIPDLHADLDRLERSLAGSSGSDLAFLGDFIDAGNNVRDPADEAVLQRVRFMVESQGAIAVLGNHELNAVLFHRFDSAGQPLRRHLQKNIDQHRSFIDRFGIATPAAIEWTEWFLSLPLWVDQGRFRMVHACWDQVAINTVKARRPDGRLQAADLPEIAEGRTRFAQAVERLTAGPEVKLPGGLTFQDYKKNRRSHARLKWWGISNGGTWPELALSIPDPSHLPNTRVEASGDIIPYPKDDPPVFVGHYKMQGTPAIEASNAICLDYPNAPCIYRFTGESVLVDKHLHLV